MKKHLILGFCFLLCGGCSSLKLTQGAPEPIPAIPVPQEKVEIAFVLGGGGSKGLAHVGVLRELDEAGIRPDLIVGCSSGAIVGALYADCCDIGKLEQRFISLKKSDLLDFSIFASRFGIVKGLLLQSFLKENIGADRFEELRIPLIVVTTDLANGELISLGAGDIIPAVQASCAVPGVFNPVHYLGRYLVDGGVADPIPVGIAKNLGAQVVIAVDVGEDLSQKEPYHFFHIAERSLQISYRKLSEYVTRDADVVIRMNFQDFGMFEDQYNQEVYELGREKAREMLPHIKKVIREKTALTQEEGPPMWIFVD